MSKITELGEIAHRVTAGSTVAIGGFQLNRVPLALLRAIAARGTRSLHAISAPNPLAIDLLAAAGSLRSADCGFVGFQFEDGFTIPPRLRASLEAGALTLRQRDVYDTIAALRSAIAADRPLADMTLLHAQRADRSGNLGIDDVYADLLLAGAGRRVLATAETLVDAVEAPQISGDRVDGVAIVPEGATPGTCFGHYGRDPAALRGGMPAGRRESATDTDAIDTFIVELARQVRDGEVVVTGLASAVPMLAIAVAQRTHAASARYINCVGAVNPRIDRVFATSVDPDLLADCEDTIDLPAIFDLARSGGVDTMFFGAGQVDGHGNMNLERIGSAAAPTAPLPGPAGSPSMRAFVRRVVIGAPRQSRRNLVDAVDVVTSSPSPRNLETVLVTDAATWQLTAAGFALRSLRAGSSEPELASRTGFTFAHTGAPTTPPPSDPERAALQSIDPHGRRFRLFAPPARSRNPSKSSERVTHER